MKVQGAVFLGKLKHVPFSSLIVVHTVSSFPILAFATRISVVFRRFTEVSNWHLKSSNFLFLCVIKAPLNKFLHISNRLLPRSSRRCSQSKTAERSHFATSCWETPRSTHKFQFCLCPPSRHQLNWLEFPGTKQWLEKRYHVLKEKELFSKRCLLD